MALRDDVLAAKNNGFHLGNTSIITAECMALRDDVLAVEIMGF